VSIHQIPLFKRQLLIDRCNQACVGFVRTYAVGEGQKFKVFFSCDPRLQILRSLLHRKAYTAGIKLFRRESTLKAPSRNARILSKIGNIIFLLLRSF